ncbi:MAG TPA: cell division protein ZipA C-terminal FtsZ-binding domain-containing protein [Burkholderiales bacterium]|nr:cell division protein ZipA C-terminal FtsZ-binding domain-containing protein [Burkholderiales bacterium]
MSELQIALLILGAIGIVAVIIYNRIQEARFRARAERAFGPEKSDALMESERSTSPERIEPQFQEAPEHVVAHDLREPAPARSNREDSEPVPVAIMRAAAATATPRQSPPAPAETQLGDTEPQAEDVVRSALSPGHAAQPTAAEDDPLSYVAELHAAGAVPPAAIDGLRRALGSLIERTRIEAWSPGSQRWLALNATSVPVSHLRLSLQLVNRKGSVSGEDLTAFQSAVAHCASATGAMATMPPTEQHLARAKELDAFCAEVDVIVGINIRAPRGRPFLGTRVRGLLEAAGFRADGDRFVFLDANGLTRFTVESHDQSPLSPEALRTAQLTGLTLLFDVPRQSDGVACFNQMVVVGRQLAQSLNGALVDDNGAPVTDAGLEQIRDQLRAIYAKMDARGIAAGSSLAQRLFA